MNQRNASARRAPGTARFFRAFVILALALAASRAAASTYFVAEGIGQGVADYDARATSALVRAAVEARLDDRAVADERRADYVLQPRLVKIGDVYVLTVEKRQGNSILFASQAKTLRLDSLDAAARRATIDALDERAIAGAARYAETAPIVSGATAPEFDGSNGDVGATAARQEAVAYKDMNRHERWMAGVGPFGSGQMENDNVMYDVAVGHSWDVHPQASLKIVGEGAFSSGADASRFFDLAAGANCYLGSEGQSTPYLAGDVGFGFARSGRAGDTASGLSLGAGIGYQFWRFSEANLDLQLRYATIMSSVSGGGYPALFGARLGVNF